MAEAADRSKEAEVEAPSPPSAVKKQRKGILSRIWRGFFGSRNEDFEKKLERLSKEEESVHDRMNQRAMKSRKFARDIIVMSGIVEMVAVAIAIITLRSLDLNWKMKIFRTLPVILSPGLSFVIYTTLVRFTGMLDRKDQRTLERLRAERKAKLDELKEITNYYTIHQLIQLYDLDPAAKAAAASVLASKLGTDSGLKVSVEDKSNNNPSLTKSSDVELVQSSGLRNRKQSHSRNTSNDMPQSVTEMPVESGADAQIVAAQSQLVVEHHQGPSPSDGGWIDRVVALLVGKDPSQSHALICGNCHRHNGLARRVDFPHIKYYCPHCHALNMSMRSVELVSGPGSGISNPPASVDATLHNFSNVSCTIASEAVSNTAAAAPHELPLGAAGGSAGGI